MLSCCSYCQQFETSEVFLTAAYVISYSLQDTELKWNSSGLVTNPEMLMGVWDVVQKERGEVRVHSVHQPAAQQGLFFI